MDSPRLRVSAWIYSYGRRIARTAIMGILDDSFVGPVIWIIVAFVGLCCLGCLCEVGELVAKGVHYRSREREIERKKREEAERAWEESKHDKTHTSSETRPVLAYDLIRACA